MTAEGNARRARLSPDALKVLETLIELFREKIAPAANPEAFRLAAFELMDTGCAHIVQEGDNFRFSLTPLGESQFGGSIQ